MELTEQEILQILRLVDQSDFGELHLETGGLKLVVRKKGYAASSGEPEALPARPAVADAQPEAPLIRAASVRSGSRPPEKAGAGPGSNIPIPSPLLGTFYPRPSPDAAPYVEIGSFVQEEDTVCIIEVMKVFTAVKAGVRGYVTEILAENGALVEYGQPLFFVRPEAESRMKTA
jgi:acetyl-CoA carboxylase biotin carboxyl carrier protein